MSMSNAVHPPGAAQCPLCGKANQCAMEVEKTTGHTQPPCWCTQVKFSAELLAQVPDALRNQACICATCASGAQHAQAAKNAQSTAQAASL